MDEDFDKEDIETFIRGGSKKNAEEYLAEVERLVEEKKIQPKETMIMSAVKKGI